jgi:hypothetical protein
VESTQATSSAAKYTYASFRNSSAEPTEAPARNTPDGRQFPSTPDRHANSAPRVSSATEGRWFHTVAAYSGTGVKNSTAVAPTHPHPGTSASVPRATTHARSRAAATGSTVVPARPRAR